MHSRLVGAYLKLGSEEQRGRFLPKCIAGETILAIGMTGPSAGSDLSSMRTYAKDTFDEALFSDATAARADLFALCRRISVEPTSPTDGSAVTIRLRDGRELARTVDVAIPVRDLPAQQEKLERKFRDLARNGLVPCAVDEIVETCRTLDREPDLTRLLRACSVAVRA